MSALRLESVQPEASCIEASRPAAPRLGYRHPDFSAAVAYSVVAFAPITG